MPKETTEEDIMRDMIAEAIMQTATGAGHVSNADRAAAGGEADNRGKYMFGEMEGPTPGMHYGGEMDRGTPPPGPGDPRISNADRAAFESAIAAGDPRISDRDAQIARNAAPPDFQGMPPMGSGNVSNADLEMARNAGSPPLPPWVGRFAPPDYPYGRKR
jgi:hypothetical protein